MVTETLDWFKMEKEIKDAWLKWFAFLWQSSTVSIGEEWSFSLWRRWRTATHCRIWCRDHCHPKDTIYQLQFRWGVRENLKMPNKSMAETQAKLLVLWTSVWNWKLGGIIGHIYYRGVEKFKKMNYVSCSPGPLLVLVNCIKIVMNGNWNPQLLLTWISRSCWFFLPVIFTASIPITAMRVFLIGHRKAFLFLQIHFECARVITQDEKVSPKKPKKETQKFIKTYCLFSSVHAEVKIKLWNGKYLNYFNH